MILDPVGAEDVAQAAAGGAHASLNESVFEIPRPSSDRRIGRRIDGVREAIAPVIPMRCCASGPGAPMAICRAVRRIAAGPVGPTGFSCFVHRDDLASGGGASQLFTYLCSIRPSSSSARRIYGFGRHCANSTSIANRYGVGREVVLKQAITAA